MAKKPDMSGNGVSTPNIGKTGTVPSLQGHKGVQWPFMPKSYDNAGVGRPSKSKGVTQSTGKGRQWPGLPKSPAKDISRG